MKPTLPWPKLSQDLPHARHPWICQACGLNLMGTQTPPHQLHLECDEKDEPLRNVVALCPPCAGKLIEPHPRLYILVPENKPVPGAMPHLCVGCRYREGLSCTHPRLKQNGGPGLNITVAEPSRGFVDGRDKHGKRWGRMFEHWPSPARACEGAAAPVPN